MGYLLFQLMMILSAEPSISQAAAHMPCAFGLPGAYIHLLKLYVLIVKAS
jgi:hypothetical protein